MGPQLSGAATVQIYTKSTQALRPLLHLFSHHDNPSFAGTAAVRAAVCSCCFPLTPTCSVAAVAGSGLSGTSGTFAAALWTADVAFEFLAAGVTGVNFHWSFGGLPGGGAAPYAGGR